MNKYEEAWKKIKYVTNYNVRAFDDDDEEIKVIQELVDKVHYYKKLEARATPMKPIDIKHDKLDGFAFGECKCGTVVDKFENEFCNRCGQALDWSEDE